MTRVFEIIRRIEEWTLAGGILLIAAVTIANAFSRTVLNSSLTFAEEIAQFAIVVVTFVGLSHAAGVGRHIRMSAIYDQFNPRIRKQLMIAIAMTTALLCFAMSVYAAHYVASVYSSGTVSPALRVPLWIPWAITPVGFALAGVQYALTVVRNLRDEGVYLSWKTLDEYDELPGSGDEAPSV